MFPPSFNIWFQCKENESKVKGSLSIAVKNIPNLAISGKNRNSTDILEYSRFPVFSDVSGCKLFNAVRSKNTLNVTSIF